MPAKLNLKIYQRATFRRRIVWKDGRSRPVNLTGYTARLQIRESASSPAVLLELSTSNGRINLTPTAGIIELYVSDEDTTAITSWSKAVYDLLMFASNGEQIRLLEGNVTVSPGVTQ